jgi:hypothetical protein
MATLAGFLEAAGAAIAVDSIQVKAEQAKSS